MTTATTPPYLDFERCFHAVSSRDSRFDGQFFTAVRTTGIYCRPSCPARVPNPENIIFLPTAAAAQHGGYRACLRCAPDAVPGSPLWNTRSDLASRAMRLIADGAVERGGVGSVAETLGYSTRQLTRVLTDELGAGPLALARAHRAHTARLLIQTTRMPMSDIAFAAGFTSIRQFNDTIREVFAMTPSRMRDDAERRPNAFSTKGTVTLRLPYRTPLNPSWIDWFLSAHAVPSVETWSDGSYARSLRLPHGNGSVSLRIEPGFVSTDLSLADMRDLAPAVSRIRHLLDLDADPVAVDAALGDDPQLAAAVASTPGIRVPGNLDGTELLLRTMIGQQISLAAAATHTARLVDALGEPIDTPHEGVTRLFPTAAAVAEHGHDVLTGPARRVTAIVDVARAIADGDVNLHAGRTIGDLRAELLALRGIGPWTADYVSMRLLADPDILLDTDLVLRQGAQRLGLDLRDCDRWAPWRSYVSMHLWRTALVNR
ncbi:AlkA N-terminal domain-containing protein [Antrihabitans cavernicola]|uniref:AlkA N-terminal domain-containing protein n=1 Tax=Antrihabitans cavernicola TaxID=2495913 RepID=UPI001659B6A2|nr:AlkA N-terminal domain-containing protein [Spelaeibacter cavernicola]